MSDERIDISALPDSQLRAAVEEYDSRSMRGALSAEVLRLRGVLVVAEDALAVKASLRDGEQGRVQRALDTVRAALNRQGDR